MLCCTLMETLSFSKAELDNKVWHVSYDGVYAASKERVHGCGSLNIVCQVEKFFNLAEGPITGHWDGGHKIQLVFGDVLLKNQMYINDVKEMYKTMSDFKDSKDGMIFKEKSDEL